MKLGTLLKTEILSVSILLTSALGVLAPSTTSAQTLPCFREGTAQVGLAINDKTATATFIIPDACGAQEVSLVSYNAPSANGLPLDQQSVFQSTTQTLNPGRYALAIQIPDCFYQVDLVQGQVIQHLSAQ